MDLKRIVRIAMMAALIFAGTYTFKIPIAITGGYTHLGDCAIFVGGLPFDEAAKEEIFTELAKDYVSGVTFSGGDPLYPANREQVGALAREVHARFPEKTIWLYTGYRWEQIADLPFLDAIDVIVDGPFIESQKNTQLCWRGSANQRVIDVRRTRETGTVCLHENTDK